MLHYIEQAKNSLIKKKGFSAAIISTMGMTIGALMCILTLAYLLFSTPLPYPEQNKLFTVTSKMFTDKDKLRSSGFPILNAENLYRNSTQFESSAIVAYEEEVVTSQNDFPKINIGFVTAKWFDLLGANFENGRGFTLEEDIDSHRPVAVVSYEFWVRELGQQPDILSKSVVIQGVTYNIIGVLAQEFFEPQIYNTGRKTEIWIPWDFNPKLAFKERVQPFNNVMFVGKVKDDLSISQTELQLSNMTNDYWQDLVSNVAYFNGWRITMHLTSFSDVILGDSSSAVMLLLFAVIGLLLIAAGNMINLFNARTVEQQKNMAIMAAVGVRRSKLFYRMLTEATMLMLAAFVLAIPVAYAGFELFRSVAFDILPRMNELGFNPKSTGLSLLVALLLAVLFSVLSIRIVNYKALNQSLQSSGKGTGVQVSSRSRNILIVSQIAVAVTIIFSNLFLFKNAYEEISKPLNFEVDQISSISFTPATAQPLSPKALDSEMRVIKQHLESIPNIKSVSRSLSPLSFSNSRRFTDLDTNNNYFTAAQDVDEDYFPMINQQVIAGSNFDESDLTDGKRVMIINETLADMLSKDESAVGKQLASSRGDLYTIKGVVSNIYLPGEDNSKPRSYLPPAQYATILLIEFKDGQNLNRTQLVKEVANASSQLLIFEMDSLEELKARKLIGQKVTVATSVVVALLSTFMCALGIYGVLSYTVDLRRYEFGTRMAVGAKGKDIIGLIVKDNVRTLLTGIMLSMLILLVLYLGFSDHIRSYLNLEMIPLFVIAIVVIALTSFIACYLPLIKYISKPAIHSLRGNE